MSTLEQIKEYWPILLAIGGQLVGGIVAWVKLNARIDNIDGPDGSIKRNMKRLDSLEDTDRQNAITFTEIKVDLAEIKTSLRGQEHQGEMIQVQIASLRDELIKRT